MEPILFETLRNPCVQKRMLKAMREGKIFVYPTDTVYGLGCNALNARSVNTIKRLKGRGAEKPLSVIAPSKKWVYAHLKVRHPKNVKRLPGPYTLVFEKCRASFLHAASAGKTVGIRIPRHPFTQFVKASRVPFVTTSVNRSGKPPAKRVQEIPVRMLHQVDIVINAGPLHGKPSTVIDLTGPTPCILRR